VENGIPHSLNPWLKSASPGMHKCCAISWLLENLIQPPRRPVLANLQAAFGYPGGAMRNRLPPSAGPSRPRIRSRHGTQGTPDFLAGATLMAARSLWAGPRKTGWNKSHTALCARRKFLVLHNGSSATRLCKGSAGMEARLAALQQCRERSANVVTF